MKKVIGLIFAIASTSVNSLADESVAVPEISPAAIPTALALLGGGILVARAYLRKK